MAESILGFPHKNWEKQSISSIYNLGLDLDVPYYIHFKKISHVETIKNESLTKYEMNEIENEQQI